MNKPPAVLEPLHHRGGQYIQVNIPNQEKAKALVRQVQGRQWSGTHQCWYVPYTPEVYRQLKELFDVRKPDRGQAMPATAPAANSEVRDLNASRQSLFVKNGKGGKDRYTFYPPLAIKYVNAYLKEHKPKPRYWLFEGLTGDQYSETSLQDIFEEARLKSGVNPHITIHGLRHSFATHLVERGVPLHVVKQLLGHENIKTTEVYLHISNKYMSEIKSPIEGLDI